MNLAKMMTLTAACAVLMCGTALRPPICEGGLLFLASYQAGDNPAAIRDPRIEGALMTFYWSQIETQQGVCDWSEVDRRIQLWARAGKKVALRFVASADGAWPHPAAKHPTPQWVIAQGAAIVTAPRTGTQIPLAWDPVYVRCADSFVQQMAQKYDGNPNILFVDLTPGAETNPYRFSLNSRDPAVKSMFHSAAASDGSRYNEALWLATVKHAIDVATTAFRRTPVLITLNVTLFREIGDYAVSRGCYTGQDGINAESFLKPDGAWLLAFRRWATQTRLYFEMFGPANARNGTLADNVRAAERGGADYFGVYAADVLKGIEGQPRFDPADSQALTSAASALGRRLPR